MLYDSKTNSVRPQRSKEESHDYRYFPTPTSAARAHRGVHRRAADAPAGVAREKRERFVEKYALSVTDAAVLTADRTVADYYEAVVHAGADARPRRTG